jgi:hypothetical protein
MTFDEWFDKNYPFGFTTDQRILGEQLARKAWEAGFQAGQDAAEDEIERYQAEIEECRQDKVWSKIHND